MNKSYERPVAEVISFTALEQMASLKTKIDSMDVKMAVSDDDVTWSLVDL